jgi:hypothetical protein
MSGSSAASRLVSRRALDSTLLLLIEGQTTHLGDSRKRCFAQRVLIVCHH